MMPDEKVTAEKMLMEWLDGEPPEPNSIGLLVLWPDRKLHSAWLRTVPDLHPDDYDFAKVLGESARAVFHREGERFLERSASE